MNFKRGIELLVAALLAIGIAIGISAGGQAEVAPQYVMSVYFKPHSDSLDKESKDALDAVMAGLASTSAIKVVGYVQQRSPDVAPFNNSRLSYRRADVVAKYIQKALGDPIKGNVQTNAKKPATERLYVVYGGGQPSEGSSSPDARRAEVWISLD